MNFDAVVIDYERATYPYQDDDVPLLDALIQRVQQKHVETVYVGGDPIYSNGVFKYIDRDKALANLAAQLARPKTTEEQARRRLSKAVFPHVKAFYDNYLGAEQVRQPFHLASSRS